MDAKRVRVFNFTLPAFILLATSILLLEFERFFIYIFPLYSFVFIWYAFQKEKETQFLVLFVLSAFGFIYPKFSSEIGDISSSVTVYAEVVVLWFYASMLSSANRKRQSNIKEKMREINANYENIKNIKSEVERYGNHRESLLKRIGFHSELSGAIRKIASLKSVDEIKSQMLSLLEKYFSDCRIKAEIGHPADAFERWVFDRKSSLFVRDASSDKKFASRSFPGEIKSMIIVPLYFFNSIIGFLRITSDVPERLKYGELQIAELISSICSVSMENLSLFEKVEQLAIKDSLTGLFTHRAFEDRMEEEILRAARTKIPFSLIMADIDHFKRYNDVYGHQAGDEVLKAAARVFSSSIRDVDFAARYGGEEFAIILTAAGKKDAVSMAEYMRKVAGSLRFEFGGKETSITVSFGVAEFPSDATISSQVVRAADERLYKAKKSGRNRVVYE